MILDETAGNTSRYYYGESVINHKGVNVRTSVGSEMDDFISGLDSRFKFRYGKIPSPHGNRPDLTSNIFYESVKWWWLIQQYNSIVDPFEEYNPGDIIKIPKI
jgi:hypothetical protein